MGCLGLGWMQEVMQLPCQVVLRPSLGEFAQKRCRCRNLRGNPRECVANHRNPRGLAHWAAQRGHNKTCTP